MTALNVKKGYDLNMAGSPSHDVKVLEKPDRVAVLPEKITFIKPRLKIETGQHVNVGTVLFEDKRNTAVRFLSPGSGEIEAINFGPRRVIQEIVIALDRDEQYESFEPVEESMLDAIPGDELAQRIMDGGMWPFIRELPFRDIARPRVTPPAIYVGLIAKEPFQPAPEVYLKESASLFEFGVNILKKLAEGRVFIFAPSPRPAGMEHLNGLATHTVTGNYPADDPGVFLYHTRKSSDDNRAWYISGQDVLLLARMLSSGIYPTERTVVLAGDCAGGGKHIRTRLGAPISHIAGGNGRDGDTRFIVGGVFKGYAAARDGYLGLYETSVTLVPEGNKKEFFGFMRPGSGKPSFSRTFLSSLHSAEMKMDCALHGEERACVNCGYCEQVCAVDILPQFTYKSILADEVEEALSHGLLDCVECGLCTYVCPSKIELCAAFKNAKAAYYREMY